MRFVALALFLAGCADGGGLDLTGEDGYQNVDTNEDNVPDNLGDPDETFDGDLADGAIISLDWADASGVYCWVSTENVNFTGNHVLFPAIDKQGSGNVVIQVDPADGVDVSIYTIENLPGSAETPPDVASPTRCEAAMDQENDNNPGATEVIGPLMGFADREILLGVAGANGATSGAFTVGIWRLDGGLIDGDTGP